METANSGDTATDAKPASAATAPAAQAPVTKAPAKKAPARKPARKPAAKKARAKPAQRKAPAKAPAKTPAAKATSPQKTAPKGAPGYSERFEGAFSFLTGTAVADADRAAIAPYAENWKRYRCEEMPERLAVAMLFSASIHGPVSVRLLQKALGLPTEGGVTDEVLAAANNGDETNVVEIYCAWVLRRAAGSPNTVSRFHGYATTVIRLVHYAITANYRPTENMTGDSKTASNSKAVGG